MARIIGKKNYKPSKLENYRTQQAEILFKERAYVCPKCKCILDENDYEVIELHTKIKFKCLICKREFNKQKVTKENLLQFSKRNYSLKAQVPALSQQEMEKKAQEKIRDFVLNFYCQGFLQSQIVDITQIPTYLVQKQLKSLPIKEEIFNEDEFLKVILNAKDRVSDIRQLQSLSKDEKYDFILKIINLGATYEFTSKLFKVSKSVLATITKEYYNQISQEDMKKILANQFKYKYDYFESDDEIKIYMRIYDCSSLAKK